MVTAPKIKKAIDITKDGKPNDGAIEKQQAVAWSAVRDEIKDLLGSISDELLRRHRIGTLVLGLKTEESKYGMRAVERLAADLGYDVSTLYEYCNVAEIWPLDEFKKLAARPTEKGVAITISHLVELSGVDNAKRRARLLEKVFTESWSVRQLKAEIHGKSRAASSKIVRRRAGDADAPKSLDDVIAAVGQSLEVQSQWSDALAQIRTLPCTKALANKLAEAVAKEKAVLAAAEENAKLLESELQRVQAALVGTSRVSRRAGAQPEFTS